MSNKAGLVSISFRKHSCDEIIAAASAAGLEAIEWGGDVHVPHGDTAVAESIATRTAAAGLTMPEYGSYYSIATSEPELFDKALASARALGAPVIRVWATGSASDTVDTEAWDRAVADARRICTLAGDITVALECHQRTLTDEYHTALAFIREVNMPNLKMFWQPNQHRPFDYNTDSIKALLPHIVAVHVFSWHRKEKLPLAAGEAAWREYIRLLSEKDLYYMLEFMHDGNIETLAETAATLKSWLGN